MKEQENGNSTIPGCIRRMTNCERVYFRGPGCNVIIAVRIAGDISFTRLRSALKTVQQVHPLLGAKVIFDERNDAWFYQDAARQIPLIVKTRVSDCQWFDELQHENRIPFNLEQGPLIRVILLHSPEISDLILLCNHSICDGMSLVNLVRDICTVYSDPAVRLPVLDPPDAWEFLSRNSRSSFKRVLTRFFVYGVNRKWNKSPHSFSQEDYEAFFTKYWEKARIGAVMLELDGNDLTRLSETCKFHRLSIGSAVTAACIAAREDVIAPFTGSFRVVMVPFDLRRRVKPPIDDVFSLCIGSPRFSYVYDSRKPFWENAARLHSEIHHRINKLDSSGLDVPDLESSLIDAFASFGIYRDLVPGILSCTETFRRFSQDEKNIVFTLGKKFYKYTLGIVSSNLGRLSIPDRYGDLKIERMIFLPGVSEVTPIVLGGVSIDGNMVFNMTFVDRDTGEDLHQEKEMIRIRNRALEYLGFPYKVHGKAMNDD